jgi:hypothetical protein
MYAPPRAAQGALPGSAASRALLAGAHGSGGAAHSRFPEKLRLELVRCALPLGWLGACMQPGGTGRQAL